MMQRHIKNLFAHVCFLWTFLLTNTAFAEKSSETMAAPQNQTCTDSIYIVVSADTIRAGIESFWVDIFIGAESMPVDSLFGVSFEVNFTNAEYLRLAGTENESLFPGPLLGGDLFEIAVPDFENGVIRVGVTRKAPADNIEGQGLLYRMNFFPMSDMPDFSQVEFRLADINAEDKDRNPISLCNNGESVSTLVLQPKDFILTVREDSLRIAKGGEARYELNLEPIGGFAKDVTLSLAESYAGIDTSFSSPTISAQNSPVFLTLSSDGASSEGVYPLTVTAAADTFFKELPIILNIYEIPLALGSESSQYLSETTFTIDLDVGDDERPVADLRRLIFTLEYSDPQYVHPVPEAENFMTNGSLVGQLDYISFERSDDEGLVSVLIKIPESANSISGVGALAHFQFTSILETPDGSRIDFTVRDVSAFDSKGATIFLRPETFSLTITEKIDFTLHLTPNEVTTPAGDAAQYQVSLTGSQSFTANVPLVVSGLPAGLEPQLQPNFVSRSSPALLTIQTDTATVAGQYSFVVTGSEGSLQKQVEGLLIVEPAALFTLRITPDRQEIFPGDSTHFVVSVLDAEHLDAPVELEIVGFEGLVWVVPQLSPQRIAPELPAELILSASNQARVGEYSFRIIGRSGNSTREAMAELHILEPPPRVRPNPFTPNNDGFNDYVIFDFDELRTGGGEVIIFDINGRKVKQLSGAQRWDGTDNSGKNLKPGAYLYVVKSANVTLDRGVIGLAR